jgi:putative flippase GtrA
MDVLANFIRRHPWWQWLTRTPFAAKMTKYALSSVLAFLVSYVTFTVGYWVSGGYTTIPSIVAFVAAALINWVMNRRWAWKQTGRAPVKETIAYACVSLVSLGITALATGRTNHWVKYDIKVENHHGLRLLIVTGAYVVINVVLFVAKFLVYEYLIFPKERGRGPGHGLPGEPQVEREAALSSGPAS